MEYNEEKEQELKSKCRYFDGMPKPPETMGQNEQALWWYERKWVFESMRGNTFKQYLNEYKAAGLVEFCNKDGVPIELKALLFERYSKGAYSLQQAATSFKDFYKQYYK
jgi:hypothetical protein